MHLNTERGFNHGVVGIKCNSTLEQLDSVVYREI